MKIKLLKPHTHAGVDHEPGAVLELDADLAQWLIDIGAAEAVKPSTRSVKPKGE